jgi:hypothetical protein
LIGGLCPQTTAARFYHEGLAIAIMMVQAFFVNLVCCVNSFDHDLRQGCQFFIDEFQQVAIVRLPLGNSRGSYRLHYFPYGIRMHTC